jgi:exodeoxyribonuclease V gamma subunit
MIRILRSNKLKTLAKNLSEDIQNYTPKDPLVSTEIVVPNRDTARWLKLFLAEINPIVANIEFILPAEWQFRMIRQLYPDLPDLLPSDPGPLAWSIYDIMMDDNLRKSFSRLDRYVSAQSSEVKERAVMQLSKKVSSVFDQYIVYRPEMILDWQNGVAGKNADEKWQANLWNLLEKKRLMREKGVGFPNKAQLMSETTEAIEAGNVAVEQSLLFFNTGLLPRPVLRMAEAASKHQDLVLYQTTVTKHFEENIQNTLLSAFGEEAKGQELLMKSLDAETVNIFDDSATDQSTLSYLQNSVTVDQPVLKKSKDQITGIEIHSCHTQLREIEVLHQFLLRRFEEDAELHPDDVLVVTPDIDSYKPLIHAVFGTEQEGTPTIPYHVDYRRITSEATTRSFLQLLDLIDSRYKFSDVMDFLMEPVVHESIGIGDSSLRRLKQWLGENNVIWGLSSEHRTEEEQPASTSQTWQSALRRGWSGIIHGEAGNPFADGAELRFSDIQGQEMEEVWSRFSHMMGHLEKLNQSIKSHRTPKNWCSLMEDEMDYFFSSDQDLQEKRSAIRQAVESIQEESDTAGFDRKISYSMFRSHVRKQLERQSASPAHFTRGVTFSSMVPVRSIPAKIIALIGLNESEFPRKPKDPDFDLMASDPRPYERSPKKQDRSLFLESILASESFHYCSYIGRSKTDNETIPPSPIVSEWLTTLSKVSGKKPEDILIEESLQGFASENFLRNRSFSKVGYLTAKGLTDSLHTIPGLYSGSEISDREEFKQLTVNGIDQFISNPLRSYFQAYFNPYLSRSEEDKDEFNLNSLEEHQIFERVFGWRLQGVEAEKISHLLHQSGLLPSGWQGERNMGAIIDSVDAAIKSVAERGIEMKVCSIEKSFQLGDTEIVADFISYSSDQFLDITPSVESGDRLLRSWIKHLAAQIVDDFSIKKSWFVCELKKGDPKWFQFQPVAKPESELKRFVSLYERGHREPLYSFPNSSYEYERAESQDKKDPLGKARSKFEGSDFSPYAENSDPFTTLMLGEGAPFRKEYLDSELNEAIRVMLNHVEEN